VNAAQRAARDQEIETLFRQNTPQVVIAARVGLQISRLHDILEARGLVPPPKKVERVTTTVWDYAEGDRLRRAIWRRQREGARAALAAMVGQQR